MPAYFNIIFYNLCQYIYTNFDHLKHFLDYKINMVNNQCTQLGININCNDKIPQWVIFTQLKKKRKRNNTYMLGLIPGLPLPR